MITPEQLAQLRERSAARKEMAAYSADLNARLKRGETITLSVGGELPSIFHATADQDVDTLLDALAHARAEVEALKAERDALKAQLATAEAGAAAMREYVKEDADKTCKMHPVGECPGGYEPRRAQARTLLMLSDAGDALLARHAAEIAVRDGKITELLTRIEVAMIMLGPKPIATRGTYDYLADTLRAALAPVKP